MLTSTSIFSLLITVGGIPFCTGLPSRHSTKLDGASVEAINNLQPAESNLESNYVPVKSSTKLNIEETIAEVQELIERNPTYPRLTRGEIIDLIENLTSSGLVRGNRDEGKKAIMVVMPFTPGNTKEMSDLYTKPPVTHIIGDGKPSKKPTHDNKSSVPSVTTNEPEMSLPINKLFPDVIQKETDQLEKKGENERNSVQNRKPVRSRRPTTTTEITTTTTVSTIETTPVTRKRGNYRRRTTTTTTRYPNHKYPQEESQEFSPNDGMRIVNAPNLANALPVQEEPPKPISTRRPVRRRTRTTTTTTTTSPEPIILEESFQPHQKPETVLENINLPDELKVVLKDINIPAPVEKHTKPEVNEADLAAYLASLGLITKTTTTTTTAIPDVSNIADTLTPEMKELLINFGLIPNPTEKSVVEESRQNFQIEPQKATVDPEAFVSFKPLPDNAPSREDMEELLSRYGLGRNSRKQKSTHSSSEGYNFDMVPDSLKPVLTDIGLQEKQPKKLPTQDESSQKHVYNPSETEYATNEELQKLNKLLDTVRLLEKLNGTVSEEELRKQVDTDGLKELVDSLNVPLNHRDAPDPLGDDDIDVGSVKNEIKREEEKKTESEGANIKDLEDSFGGVPTVTTTSAPPSPKSGFYYLLDWNSFLDIDDQVGRHVNLRFQPKVGDPKRFLSVSVP